MGQAYLGYLIGLTKATFGEWLNDLRALPPAERARRLPGGQGLRSQLTLRELPDGRFELEMRPAGQYHRVREGEFVRYSARQRHAVHDWCRFPVSSIPIADAEASTRWLDPTGRLPGARLCDEREWERGARGGDGCLFPHGDRLEPEETNFSKTYGRQQSAFGPDEVGRHPGAPRAPSACSTWPATSGR